MNRININTLKEIETTFGSFDIDQKFGGSKDVYLRFGYWQKVNINKLQSILSPGNVVTEQEWEDDDCGWLFSYYITASYNGN